MTTLYPLADVEGDRLVRHPGGRVLLRISKHATIAFDSEQAMDDFFESVDRERSPGRDPWATPDRDLYWAGMQALRAERERLAAG